MADNHKQTNVKETAQEAMRANKPKNQGKQFVLWFGALIVGAILGWMGIHWLNELFNFVATVFTRLFQFIAVPTIALAVITTLAALGGNKETGIIFAHAVTYTLLTTFLAAFIGLGLYIYIAPDNLPALRDILLEKEGNNTNFLSYRIPYNESFNVVYTLSNKGKKAFTFRLSPPAAARVSRPHPARLRHISSYY